VKRGYTSPNGVVTATCGNTGKVTDVTTLPKHCACPDKFKGEHADSCAANHSGASGGMWVAGVKKSFQHSIPQQSVKYINFLGNGDSVI
jgi:hypothetical protein